jgi:hypothetical protein
MPRKLSIVGLGIPPEPLGTGTVIPDPKLFGTMPYHVVEQFN